MKAIRSVFVAALVGAALCMGAAIAAPGDSLPETKLGGGGVAGKAADSLKKDAVCTRCHDESENWPVLSLYQTKHGVRGDSRTPNCQSCHGESEKHLKGDPNVKGRAAPDIVFKKGNFTTSSAEDQSEPCLTCHKSGKRMHWDGSQHQSRDVQCSSCHKVHNKGADPVLSKRTQPEVCYACHKTQRAETHKFSTHPIDAGKVACSDCHNPHGSTGPKLLAKNSVNELCHTCHAEKRGPFLFEHQPVVDDCTNCHTPHGSSNLTLLKARTPYLCQQCHQDHGRQLFTGAQVANGPGSPAVGATLAAATGLAGKQLSIQGNGRMCLNCHVQIHGTNAPNGGFFNR